ncbi:MAG: inositol monophosphatase family protein [Candidatus Binatia bacterium]
MAGSYLNFIARILGSASKIAIKNFGKVSATTKAEDNNQVLTKTDLEIGQFLIGHVRQLYPKHNIIDEEAGVIDNHSEFTWVIDPIDGTSNFASGSPLYGIMVGLLSRDIPFAAGIALPAFFEIYVAQKGQGAYCNKAKISVSKEANLKSALVAYGIDSHQRDPDFTRKECKLLAEIILNIRNLRSSNSVYDAAMVARGNYGAVLNRSSKIWDNVAQQVVIEEAGGIYTDFFGEPIDYSDPLNKTKEHFTFCAASPALHEQIQRMIRVFS